MALMDYGYDDPSRVAEREEAEKKRQKWLDEDIELKLKENVRGFDAGVKVFFIKRRDLIDFINGSGALNDIQETCRNYRVMNMRF